jgi:hypothetical protein
MGYTHLKIKKGLQAMKTAPTASSNQIEELRTAALDVGVDLSAAYQSLVAALPGRPSRPTDIANSLGVTMNLAYRLATALKKDDPLDSLLTMPGPAPLHQVIKIAESKDVAQDICQTARDAVHGFEELIRSVGDNRTTFDALISEWVPEARDQIETTARQLIYRGIRQVKGTSAAVHFQTCLLHPSETNVDRIDELVFEGYLGLERVRLNGNLALAVEGIKGGRSLVAESSEILLEDFCSVPLPTFEVVKSPARSISILKWGHTIGRDSAQDVVVGAINRNMLVHYRQSEEEPYAALISGSEAPAKRFIFDVLFHKDVYNECIPFFHVYATGGEAFINPNDPLKEFKRLHVDCEIQSVPTGHIREIKTPEISFYQKMLKSQCDSLGWDLREFRAFRVRLDYPIFESHMQFVIPLPDPPHE